MPAIWDSEVAPNFFRASVKAVESLVRNATVCGVFYSRASVLGTPETGEWKHMHASLPSSLVFSSPVQSEFQAEAAKLQDMKTLKRALAEFPAHVVRQAKTLLESDALYRSEKVLGVATWLLDLQGRLEGVVDSRKRAAILWRAVAEAPAGFCHVRSSMIGTLLEDIVAGLPFDVVSRKFSEKMHPLQYQRPTAAPTNGQIAEAEKLVERMGIASALERRFALVDELEKVWEYKPKSESTGVGVFSHLKRSNQVATLDGPSRTITWHKFARDVLPNAERIEYQTRNAKTPFVVHVTAVHADAPPVLQWDSPEHRNQVSWYLHANGSFPSEFGLSSGIWVDVEAVSLAPHMWHGRTHANQGEHVALILLGCHETHVGPGGGLFVECLRSELHPVRSVIEAHVKKSTLPGREQSACGVMMSRGVNIAETVRVTSGGVRSRYIIDRWD